ncbi:MAG: response regulator [Pirellulales bacterium]
MTSSLRVALADDHAEIRSVLARMVQYLGHRVIFAAATGQELVEQCLATHPDLVITDVRMPDMDGLEAARIILELFPTPVIVLSAYYSRELVQRAAQHQILDYLLKPVSAAQLGPAIALARRRFDEMRALRREADLLRRSLADQDAVERARQVLTEQLGLDETKARARLEQWAVKQDRDLVQAARAFLAAEELLRPGAHQGF